MKLQGGLEALLVLAPLVLAGCSATSAPRVQAPLERGDGALLLHAPTILDAAPRASLLPSAQNPAFSPDGERILFTLFHQGYNGGPAGLYTIQGNGSSYAARLFDEPDHDAVNLPGTSWNGPTGRIAFASDREDTDNVWSVAADGRDLRRVTRLTPPAWAIEPSWSPDGASVVYEVAEDAGDGKPQGSIWTSRADGSSPTRLTAGGDEGADDRQPNWSPRGDRILFQRRAAGSDDWDVMTMRPDGSDLRRVTGSPWSDTDASWSPDGAWIVYSSDHGELPTVSIFVVPAIGGLPTQVTHEGEAADGAPSWSPDGRWIAFESYPLGVEEGAATLWRIAAPALPLAGGPP